MNIHHNYALTFRSETNQFVRKRNEVTRLAFFCSALLVDVAVIVSMAWLTGVSYHLSFYGHAGDLRTHLTVGIVAAALFVVSNLFRQEYHLHNFFEFKPHLRRTIELWNVTLISLLVLAFLAQITMIYSRAWIVIFYAVALGCLLATRYAFVRMTILGSRLGVISAKRIFLIGAGRQIDEFIATSRPRESGVNIVGCQFLRPRLPVAPQDESDRALAEDIGEAMVSARLLVPDAIFLVMPWSDTGAINRVADALLALPAEIHLGAEKILQRHENLQLSKLGPMVSLQLTRLPLTRLELFEKRVFDIVVAGAALLLLTPLLVAVAILIKLDSAGPVFFLQRRHGFNQKPFRIIKFRTMRTLDDGPVVSQATKDDPRVTRVGRWLRRLNIDELPQLFNVITGDMSLVGPRPHALAHDHEYERKIALYARRHNVKPGITGWAQVNGFRGETDTDDKMRQRVDCDLYYIDNWSPWLDFQILLRTVASLRSYKNAY